MIFFITFLRALATCFITNSHYTGIYPTDLIANGGLLGNVLFFAVSGYCLFNVKYELSLSGFGRWYGKRIRRVYPSVFIITALYMALGAYSLSEHDVVWWYVYPTCYHFVASIMVLYIPFFFLMKINVLRDHIVLIMCGIAVVWLATYFIFYDKSYYHIDSVREPMIRFLFMESMLLGAWFRQNDDSLRNNYKVVYPVVAGVAFLVYFVSKRFFSQNEIFTQFQFLNQIAIFAVLYFTFRTFCGLDAKLEKAPSLFKRITIFISRITLEIYVVQYVIIQFVRELDLAFPVNWCVATGFILGAASILHKVCNIADVSIERLLLCQADKKAL